MKSGLRWRLLNDDGRAAVHLSPLSIHGWFARSHGVNGVVRRSARMSGTVFGSAVLHAAAATAADDPLALVQEGALSGRDARGRQLDLKPHRGYRPIYSDHVTQAGDGCGFDFLRA